MTKPVSGSTSFSPDPESSSPKTNGEFNFSAARDFLRHTKRSADAHLLSPLQAISKDVFKTYPTFATYMMLFAGLSALPIMAFIGFSLFAGSVLVGLAALFVATWGSVLIGSALAVLIGLLAALLVASFWILIGLCVALGAIRLSYNIQTFVVQRLKESQLLEEIAGQLSDNKRSQMDRPSEESSFEKPNGLAH